MHRTTTKPAAVVDVAARYEWKKVDGPKTWRPRMVGEELAGYYGGKTVKTGRFGQYEVVIVHVPRRGMFMVSGIQVVQLVDAAGIDPRWPIRIVWKGVKQLPEDRTMKVFEVFVAEGDPLTKDEMPKLQETIA